MTRLIAAWVLLVAATPACADEKPKPNMLTPKEIADGWILLFDGETTFGWKIDGDGVVKDGTLVLGGPKGMTATVTTTFDAYEAKFEVQGAGVLAFPEADESRSVNFNNPPTIITVNARTDPANKLIEMNSNDAVGGVQRMAVRLVTATRSKLRLEVKEGGKLAIKSAKLRPLRTKPLFTGKSLDGWKINAADPKRMASKFVVTKDGELSVKNGPGDLVTEKEFDNFVLQFDCKTLGPALNSGIFFRCIPGQYQNGYEAQIQNAYLNNDRTKPADFGTGAIYRRVPARKVVSNDNDWFTMTVVADGKHIATWVNGYQTVDWTDERKANDNPRQGYRATKGPLSIQGHDKTTDLLFRNIRIAELPK
jgi:hypothetical protein